MTIVQVALDVPVDRLFDYLAPDADVADIGRCVHVSFGNRKCGGIILAISHASAIPHNKLKAVSFIDRDTPALSTSLLKLFEFCSSYYHHPIGQVIANGLPTLLRNPKHQATNQLQHNQEWVLTETGKNIGLEDILSRSKAKRNIFSKLLENGVITAGTYQAMTPYVRKQLRELANLGWVAQQASSFQKLPFKVTSSFTPTTEQQHAIAKILAHTDTFTPWLLHGITGSGKTEIYLQIAATLLAQQKQVLVLVPEINLTPQLEAVFRQRFPTTLLVSLHSGLNHTERLQGWLHAQQGKAGIILGTRLAIFTPIPKLGLIIVDEEQDHSFKQQDGLRYSARDLAVYRARQANVPIILGSATPSLESYQLARSGRYQLLQLHTRAISQATLPTIRCIDTRTAPVSEGFSESILKALDQSLRQKQQSLVFINRRGYSPVLLCKSCNWIATCGRCSSRLVVHLRNQQLRCHYCGDRQSIMLTCPQCGDPDILPLGHGTQRIEATLTKQFPQANILRVDRDSIRQKTAWRTILNTIHRGEADILIGTQLLAKGHDFPNLGLVCVLNADSSLYSTDFRAEEHLFAQLMQVAGRAGRAHIHGTVLIQTEFPQHPLYQALTQQDYAAYAQVLLATRKAAYFPPFSYLAVLRAEAPELSEALTFLKQAADTATTTEEYDSIQLFDPVPAYMVRLKGLERAQLLIQAASRKRLQIFLDDWYQKIITLPVRGKLRWHLDVDPLTI